MNYTCEGDFSNATFISRPLLETARAAELFSWSFGSLVAIAFLGLDGWRAFHRKKHWIPCDSFLLGALTLLLLTLLNLPSAILHFPQDDEGMSNSVQNLVCCSETISRRMLVLAGRVSLCVVMGCMLPGLARPRSSTSTLWSDMAALIITCSTPILALCYEIYVLSIGYFYFYNYKDYDYSYDYYFELSPRLTDLAILKLWICTILELVSFVILILLLVSAALTTIIIQEIVSNKIPLVLSDSTPPIEINSNPSSFSNPFLERVEDQIVKSWIVVCTCNPQYIIARSVLSSSVAFVILVSNAILMFAIVETDFTVSIHMVLHWLVILLGSSVIYWRWITAVVFCPRSVGKQWTSIKRYFKIEDFWKRYLLELNDVHKSHREMGESSLRKLMLKVGRKVRVHKLVPPVVWLQVLLVFFSKVCWLVSQLFLSNKYLRKLLISSAREEFPHLYGGNGLPNIELGRFSYYEKYPKAFITMNGENPACLWVANRNSIQGIKTQIEMGEEEVKRCQDLVDLLKSESHRGTQSAHPQKRVPIRLGVGSDFDICQLSFKLRVVSIITVMFELCPFSEHACEKTIGALEACSQAWSIMDLVENSDTEAFQVSKASDKLFQGLQKRGKLLHNHLQTLTSITNASEAARVAVDNLAEKAKRTTEEHRCRTWNEVVESYSLWMVCVNIGIENIIKVEGIICELLGMLADEIGSCMAKALDIVMEDSEKWATMAMEHRIWIAAHTVRKVKSITRKLRWMLTCDGQETVKDACSNRLGFPALRKRPTFQIG